MELELEGSLFYGKNISVSKENDVCTVHKMKDATGESTMICYRVFPGIDLLYNDFHIQRCFSKFHPQVEMIRIDHCREGCIEWEFQNSYTYLQRGDLQINAQDSHNLGFGFPLKHYHGITIAIYIKEAEKTLAQVFDGFYVDLQALREKFCCGQSPFIMRAKDSKQDICSELYNVPDSIRINYYKLKVLELLLFLSAVDIGADGEQRSYFPKNHVETVKEIMKFITLNIDRRFTLDELSCRFEIPLTSMKLCFKGIYGTPMYAFIRNYRMQAAALMLRQSSENVSVIAGKVGYDNSSKFAAAFKDSMNMSPLEYRKSICPHGAGCV